MRACHRERLTVELAEHAERAGEERALFREIDGIRPRPGERGISSGGDHETNRSVEVRRERIGPPQPLRLRDDDGVGIAGSEHGACKARLVVNARDARWLAQANPASGGVEHVTVDPRSAQLTPRAVTNWDQLAHRRAFETYPHLGSAKVVKDCNGILCRWPSWLGRNRRLGRMRTSEEPEQHRHTPSLHHLLTTENLWGIRPEPPVFQ